MSNKRNSVAVTGASQGIDAGLVKGFLERGFAVVANAREMTQSNALKRSQKLALVDRDVGRCDTVANIVEAAIGKFGSIDALVNNAGIFFAKLLTSYTTADLGGLVSTNLEGLV
jgi:NADP-dependent 3-hydroxy acid dehydrogenase YdfG